jgi:hypothetical protein
MSESQSAHEVTTDRPNSVEISVNAKGEISYKIKVYADAPVYAMQEAIDLKHDMDAWIATQTPRTK